MTMYALSVVEKREGVLCSPVLLPYDREQENSVATHHLLGSYLQTSRQADKQTSRRESELHLGSVFVFVVSSLITPYHTPTPLVIL